MFIAMSCANGRDVFDTANQSEQRGIRVRRGKHNKSWIVMLTTIQAYLDLDVLGLDAIIFRGVKREKGGLYSYQGDKLSTGTAEYMSQMVKINCHDLRRTYAKLCKQSGMSWKALRANMGHSSVTLTE